MMIIRANHDIQTHYLYVYSEEIIKEAQDRNQKVIKIEGDSITERIIRSRIKSNIQKFIFFNGHGNNSSLFNNEKEPFIEVSTSDVFKDTITFTRACDCLKELGKSAIQKGCKSFIGYNKKFWIARHHKYECTPLNDEVAKPILECSNIVPIELIKGKTVIEAVNKSHEKSADYILKLIHSKEPLAIASLQALIANDSALDFEGDSSANINL